ncbi:MAG TPA: HIT family hydrolase [Planctomycetaceae bacterium]|nr:HIT family hydrolase [Planctomycetaceae bacterium]
MDDILWAPWRLAYIAENERERQERSARDEQNRVEVRPDGDPGCFLCQAVADPERKRRLVIGRSENTIALLNKFPYNNGHLLLAPLRHVGRLDRLSETEQAELTRELNRLVIRLEEKMRPHGFNIGLNLGHAAGAGLPGHLHWHIVPRWNGDTNFMTSIASTKVIPQALEALWEILAEPS